MLGLPQHGQQPCSQTGPEEPWPCLVLLRKAGKPQGHFPVPPVGEESFLPPVQGTRTPLWCVSCKWPEGTRELPSGDAEEVQSPWGPVPVCAKGKCLPDPTAVTRCSLSTEQDLPPRRYPNPAPPQPGAISGPSKWQNPPSVMELGSKNSHCAWGDTSGCSEASLAHPICPVAPWGRMVHSGCSSQAFPCLSTGIHLERPDSLRKLRGWKCPAHPVSSAHLPQSLRCPLEKTGPQPMDGLKAYPARSWLFIQHNIHPAQQ